MAKIIDIRSQTPKRSTTRNVKAITTIVRHHSATTTGDFWTFWNGRWKDLGWQTGGYHEIILRDGTVQLCYDATMMTNGAANCNSYCYHICLVGNGSFTELQEQVFTERCKLAMERFQLISNDVKGHRELPDQATACPGVDMKAVRERLALVSYPQATVIYQGKPAQALLIDGKTMVQIRDLAILLGVQIDYDSKTRTTTFNQKPVSGQIIEGRTYLHVRKAATIVGLNVAWHQQLKTVVLT